MTGADATDEAKPITAGGWSRPYAIVLGTNEIATAVAIALLDEGWGVVLAHDPNPPVLRRGMAFHDALFGDPALVRGVAAERADTAVEVVSGLARSAGAIVTGLGLLDLIVLARLDLLVDARLQPAPTAPDLRWLARISVGIGPGFSARLNCDIAIRRSDEPPVRASEALAKRTIHAAGRGVWRMPLEIGTQVFKDFVVGHLDGAPIRSPMDGVITGAVRDGTEVSAAVELVEIDRRVRRARWSGLDERGWATAQAVLRKIRAFEAENAALSPPAPAP